MVIGLGFTAGHTWDRIPGSAVCVWADSLNFLSLRFLICKMEVLIVPPQCLVYGWHAIHDFIIMIRCSARPQEVDVIGKFIEFLINIINSLISQTIQETKQGAK